jgi:hypothetical protein
MMNILKKFTLMSDQPFQQRTAVMKRYRKIGINLEKFYEGFIGFFICSIKDIVEIPDGLMIMQGKYEFDL